MAMTDVAAEFIPYFEGSLPQMRELERQLLDRDIDVSLAKPPAKACCAGGCGCGGKLQLLVRPGDVPKVAEYMQSEWKAALEREGLGGQALVTLQTPGTDDGGDLACPACGFRGPLQQGACGDCGLQLEG